jgi:hypothetical protein
LIKISCRHDEKKSTQRHRCRGGVEAKAEVIEREGILVFFDDQPECLKQVDSMRSVMLVRNGGDFDFADQKRMFSEGTEKLVGALATIFNPLFWGLQPSNAC